jgi:predicted DNA binding CopG/RHH family protein
MLIAQSLVNKKGDRLVDSENPEALHKAIESLKKKDAAVNGRVTEAILELNGLNKSDAKALAKNALGEAQSGASPSDAH